MKIAYIAVIDISKESGVLKKITKQIKAWEELGVTVKLFAISPSTKKCFCMNDIDVEIIQLCHRRYGFFIFWFLKSCLKEWGPKIIYLRLDCYFPFIERLMKTVPTFLEINSNDLTEARTRLSKIGFLYHLITREIIIKNAVGFLFLTPEIAKKFIKYKKPYTIIGDSIDFTQYKCNFFPNNEAPHLVFIGCGAMTWFGIDKILYMANIFPQWKFDLIGISPSELTECLPGNVIAHGHLPREKYEQIIKFCDIGISTLALHRIDMDESTPLKTREYLAYGMPVILGYKDPDFSSDAHFILNLPNTENNVRDNISQIEIYVNSWKGKRVPSADIYFLAVEAKEKQRIEFILSDSIILNQ